MKHILLLLFIPQILFAQLENSTFWEVSGKGLSTPSYLYGTMHVFCKNKIILTPQATDALLKSKALYLEINFKNDVNEYKSLLWNFNKKGTPIWSYFTTVEFEKINKLIRKKYHVKAYRLQHMKPEILLEMLYPTLINCKVTSYEAEFEKIANKNGIRIESLETFEEHFASDTSATTKEAISTIKQLLISDNKKDNSAELEKLMRDYSNQNIQKIYDNGLKEAKKNKEEKFLEALLDTRNKNWIPRIEKTMQKHKTFFAFGAGHLAGPNGVINLLRKQGYTVKAVRNF